MQGATAKAIALAAALSMLLYGSGFLVFLSPLPLLYVHLFFGRRAAVLSSLMAFALLLAAYVFLLPAASGWMEKWPMLNVFVALPGAGLSPSFSSHVVQWFGIGYFVYYIMIALLLGEGVSRQWRLGAWIGISTVLPLVFVAAAFFLLQAVHHTDVIGGIRSYMTVVIDEMLKAKAQFGGGSQLDLLKEYSGSIIDVSIRIIPATLAVSTFFVVIGNALVGRWLCRRPEMFAYQPEVRSWRVPDHMIWAAIASGALFFADTYLFGTVWMRYVAVNLLIVLAAIYFAHGLIIVSFLLRTKPLLVKILIFASILLFFQVMALIFVAMGFTDLWFDFRRLNTTLKVKDKGLKKESELWK